MATVNSVVPGNTAQFPPLEEHLATLKRFVDDQVRPPRRSKVKVDSLLKQQPAAPASIRSKVNEINLKDHLSDLSANMQATFETRLEEIQQAIAGFASVFSKRDKTYEASKEQMTKADIRERFYNLREKDKLEYQSLKAYYDQIQVIFSDRLQALKVAIAGLKFENALLEKTITGNASYYNSFSLLTLSTGYRYGAAFRLGELNQGLEARKASIGIKETDPTNVEAELPLFSQTCQSLVQLSKDIVILKEEVTICNEALQAVKQEVTLTDLPYHYYLYHKQRLEATKDSLTSLDTDFKERKKQLEESLKLETSTPNSEQALAYQRELVEISTRHAQILKRQNEIDVLLAHRVSSFGLSEKDLTNKEPIKIENFSESYATSLDLIQGITLLKEEVVLSNIWEKFDLIPQRRFAYFQSTSQRDMLTSKKAEFEAKELPGRQDLIATVIRAHTSAITSIEQSMSAINGNFSLLEKASQARANWDVNPLPPTPRTAAAIRASKEPIV